MKNSSYAPARQEGGWKPTVLFWIVAAVVLLLVLLFALAGGLGVALFILGLIALLTGLYALLFKRPSWVGLPHRQSGGLLAIAGFVVFALGVGVTGATATPRADINKAAEVTTPKPSATKTATPTATPTPTNPANSICTTAAATKMYNSQTLICTAGGDQRLVWMTEADSKKVVAEKAAAEKEAADKAASELAAAELAAAEKAAAEKAAAEAAQAAAAQAAAAQAAAEQAAREAAARPAPQAPVAPAPVAPAPAPAPAAAPFANCAAAKAAGAAPVYAGTPGYGTHLDRDRDGIGCDK